MKKVAGALLSAAFTISAFAQSGTNSPYSQYGLGLLSDQASGFNRGMNGLGYGFRENDQVNFINPASYSALDSLTFVFDAGISGQLTNFTEKGRKKNARNADLEYVVAGLRLARRLGLSFGLVPFTNVGYNYASTSAVNVDENNAKTTVTSTYAGNGGLHQAYLGMGWVPFKGLSLGFNVSYLWGALNRSVVNSYNDQSVNTVSKYYSASVKNYKLDLGLQYAAQLSKKDRVTLGAVYGLGHKLAADSKLDVTLRNPQTGVQVTTSDIVRNGLELPTAVGGGLAWNRQDKWKLGVDYLLQQWSETEYPVYSASGDETRYALSKNVFNDRHRFTVGGEFCQDLNSRSFFKRIRYRLGASYATSYIKINGVDGPDEISVSAGFGIPIANVFNNRSLLNVSAQWIRQDARTFIKENTFRINVGLTFNERWFAKWKVN